MVGHTVFIHHLSYEFFRDSLDRESDEMEVEIFGDSTVGFTMVFFPSDGEPYCWEEGKKKNVFVKDGQLIGPMLALEMIAKGLL